MEKIKGIMMLLISVMLMAIVFTVVIGSKRLNKSIYGLILGISLFLLTGLVAGLLVALFFKLSYSMTIISSFIGLFLTLLVWLFLRYSTPDNASEALGAGMYISWAICFSFDIVFCFIKGLSYLTGKALL